MSLDRTQLAPYEGDEGAERLAHDASALRSLVTHPGWPVYVGLLHGSRERAVRRMVQGQAKAHHDYANQAGTINGLDMAEELPAALLEHAQRLEKRAAVADGEGGAG